MSLPLSHWKDPRSTIACVHKDNDMAYATHGAIQSLKVLSFFDLKMTDFKNMTILDYGCGTGRIARPLTALFKHVYAYDPVKECIALAETECGSMKFHNLTLTTDLSNIPHVDLAFSVSVMEHLTDTDAIIMMENLARLVKGDTVLWYSVAKNSKALSSFVSETEYKDQIVANQVGEGHIQLAKINFKHR